MNSNCQLIPIHFVDIFDKIKVSNEWYADEWKVGMEKSVNDIYQAESSSKMSVQEGDSLGRIGLKEKVGFHFEQVTLMNGHEDVWVVKSREQELDGRWICRWFWAERG